MCNCLPLKFLKVPYTSEENDKHVTGILCSFRRNKVPQESDRLPCHHKVKDTLTVLLLCQMETSGKVRAKAMKGYGYRLSLVECRKPLEHRDQCCDTKTRSALDHYPKVSCQTVTGTQHISQGVNLTPLRGAATPVLDGAMLLLNVQGSETQASWCQQQLPCAPNPGLSSTPQDSVVMGTSL